MSVRVLIVATDSSARARLRHLVEDRIEVVGGVGNAAQVREAVSQILAASPDTEVLVASDRGDTELVREVLESGAAGYLVAASTDGASQEPADDRLTNRQRDVLRLLAFGHTNQEIAERLALSVRTVETHRAHLMQKLKAQSRADLVRYALDRGLLTT